MITFFVLVSILLVSGKVLVPFRQALYCQYV